MDVRKPNSLFAKGIDPDALWGRGKHTFYLKEGKHKGPVQRIKTESVSVITGVQIFGETVKGDKIPKVKIVELAYSGVPTKPYMVEYSIDGGVSKSRVTSELVSPEVIRENPELKIKFYALAGELELEGEYLLADEVGRLVRQANPTP